MTPEAVPDAPADPLRFPLSARIPTDGHLFTKAYACSCNKFKQLSRNFRIRNFDDSIDY